jgi:hypothetical protein
MNLPSPHNYSSPPRDNIISPTAHRVSGGVAYQGLPEGGVSMAEAIQLIADQLLSLKKTKFPNSAMTVALEGLSNTGKSTLGAQLGTHSPQILFVEGDLFHRGTAIAMPVYERLIKSISAGKRVPRNFPTLIWNFTKLRRQLLTAVESFNNSREHSCTLELTNVLENKKSGTEHTRSYTLDRNSIVLVTGMYLRQLRFDQYLYLTADPDVTIARKIDRGRADGKPRDPSLTRNMVELIEHPALLDYHRQHPVLEQIIINTTCFDRVSISIHA